MSATLITELAARFWNDAGSTPRETYDFASLVPLALPLAVVTLPAISIDRIEHYLAIRGTAISLDHGNRRLRGGLIAHRGHGFAFVDGADVDDERRFTLAHEVAHFLIDYLHPRERALRRLGDPIAEVLDGFRQATPEERTDALLAACPLGVFIDLLDRGGNHGAMVDARERRADRLACELLAPADALATRVRDGAVDELARHLREVCGLPTAQALTYARTLHRESGHTPTFVDWLTS